MPLRFTPINYPASTATQAIGLNNNDVVTGLYLDGGGTHPFTEQNGSYSTLPLDAGHSVTPFGVNDLGQYVGFFSDGAGQHGFLYSAGLYATIDDPNATGGTQAAGINDAGEIVGVYTDGTGEHGFLENNGTYITINAPGATTTLAVGINASGVISGTFMDSGGTAHGFIDNNGSFTVIDDPLATQGTQVLGINDHNQVVGTYKVNGVQHGFVWSNGTFTTIDDPACTANEAVGINNAGQISGFGKIGLNDQGFLSSPLHVAPDDFSGDNMSDVLWRQSGGGLMAWQMNGGTIAGNGAVSFQGSPVAPDSSWTMVGTGDFSFDGTADVLWRQTGSGLTLWQMSGSTINSSSTVTYQGNAIAPDASWSVAATSDFTGDGKTDVLWRQSSGALNLWQMDGSTITSSMAVSYQGNAITPDASWSVAGSGDFNDDGNADLVWRQSSGALNLWQMNGSTVTQSSAVTYQGNAVTPDSSWSMAGVGDFNGDNHADMLWRQGSTGSLAEWLMNGSTITSTAAVTFHGSTVAPDSSWSIVEIGDFNNDGNTDILWRQSTTGTLSEWLMNGSTITASNTLSSMPDQTWQVQSKPTSFV